VEIVFDHRPADADPARQALAVVEPLLACFQRALGHELPNRLVAAQGLARLLLDQAERLDAEGRDLLRRLADGVRLADELVRSLADLGRLLRDPGPAGPVHLAEVATEAAAGIKVLFPDRPIEYHLGQDLPVLSMPHKPWLYLLTLLFRQALEATPADRPVRLEVGACAVAGGVEVRVTDNGPAPPEAELRQRFDPFARGGEGLGQGLGLFPVRLLVAGWGGVLRVASEPPRGTVYRLFVRSL
jgi:signal transduction histidine kinase